MEGLLDRHGKIMLQDPKSESLYPQRSNIYASKCIHEPRTPEAALGPCSTQNNLYQSIRNRP